MDTRLRDLERRARSGDAQAAHHYFVEVSRLDDLVKIYEAMMLLAETQHPGLMQQIREINEMVEQVKIQEVEIEDPPLEIWTTNNSLEGAANQCFGSQTVTVASGSCELPVQFRTSSSTLQG